MKVRKFLNIAVSLLVLSGLLFGNTPSMVRAENAAMPMNPTDETKVPHYFGPNPNWANSPFTLPDAVVVIDPPKGVGGIQAEATATVGMNGIITDITVTNPGDGYTTIPKVTITGSGTGATAKADIAKKGVVTAITVDSLNPGAGYTQPVVVISGGSAAVQATATAYGGVDNVALITPGSGYTFPTVDFDLPDAPDGTQATGHAVCTGDDPLGPGPFCVPANPGDTVTIVSVAVDNPGSGYSKAPGVVIRNGTLFDPIAHASQAEAIATLSIQNVVMDTFGADYKSVPTVTIDDAVNPLTITPAVATATVDTGGVVLITITNPGSGYITKTGIKKFTDPLPGLCAPPNCPSYLTDPTAKYIPLAVAEAKMYNGVEADEYEIAVVQYRTSFSSSLKDPLTGNPVGTLVRGYVQLETPANAAVSQHFPLHNELLDGTMVPTGYFGVTPPQYLGPTIVASKDKPVRIVFRNLLPTGASGDLFLPVDSTIMGSGEAEMNNAPYDPRPVPNGDVMDGARNPMCTDKTEMGGMMRDMCFTENRATLHLHGGNTPWISDGTVHQWITPANESTLWPEGISVENVPDMDVCGPDKDGCMTFYYTNQQSARLMFYHDHSWGITRLNVYAGEAAGYLITDEMEQKLIGTGGAMAGLGVGIPLVIQDKTFVPQDTQLYNQYDANGKVISYGQDPAWDAARWGGYGNFWYHHVYMPAQNPGDPGGMSAFGRWMYGPWFWPPAGDAKYGPIANPYYGKDPEGPDGSRGTADDWTTFLATPCSLDNPATWQYDTDPFCEPELIPGTPNISAGMEQFNDTPLVNGTAYPTLTLEPKTYRFRILSAANDRFFNFQWYVADPSTASTDTNTLGQVIGGTEVALNEAELAAAQTDPVVFPTPDTIGEAGDPSFSLPGPDWIQIGTEGGFLPAPVVVDGQQVTTWITDPTRFDVGNVDLHSLLLAPAERADVIVDFSKFAGQTLILYNDAPAAFPARIPSYDYYTGAPDLSPVGAPTILPGYGPNTRTIMQVKIAGTPAPAFNLTALKSAFSHKANGSGVFESSQHPVIVGQAAYNSAYGTSFAGGGWCSSPTSTVKCDGFARINQQGGDPFTFDTLRMKADGTYPAGYGKVSIPLEPKAIHDETNASNFDEFGRMQANLGVEVVPATPGLQNVVLHPFVFPMTEIIDTTGLPAADVKVTPISAPDGTQIWKITHNGVDTHPIHFHAYDVQVINRVTWDNIIIPPDLTELGWKDTVRIAPLEDTIVALRPIIPKLPFDLPNSIRLLSMMMPEGSPIALSSVADGFGLGMTAFAPNGDPIDVYNHYVNFGAEYVYHCHILSHEEMDMMRPVTLAFPPVAPSGLAFDTNTGTLSWTDNSRSETAFVVEKSADGIAWTEVGRIDRPLLPGAGSTIGDTETFIDQTWVMGDRFRVVAQNTVGDTWDYADPNLNEILVGGFPTITTTAISEVLVVTPQATPADPTNLTATLEAGPQINLAWTDNADNETGFIVERSDNGGAFVQIGTAPAFTGTNPGTVTYVDLNVAAGNSYTYQVAAINGSVRSNYSNTALVSIVTPAVPTNLTATYQAGPPVSVSLAWTDNATDETGFVIERSTDGGITFSFLNTVDPNISPAPSTSTYVDLAVTAGNTYYYRVAAFNLAGRSAYSNTANVSVTPAPPTNLIATLDAGPQISLAWTDNATDETGFIVERSDNGGAFVQLLPAAPAFDGTGIVPPYIDTQVLPGHTYDYRVAAFNLSATSAYSNTASVMIPGIPPIAPDQLDAVFEPGPPPMIALAWQDNSLDETGFVIERSTDGGPFSVLANAVANVTTYDDLSVLGGYTYTYRVAAFNANGTSTWSVPTASASVPPDATPPAAPSNLSATNVLQTSLTLTWTDNSNNEAGFTIQRATDSAFTKNLVTINVPGANLTNLASYNDSGLAKKTKYFYRVLAYNGFNGGAGPFPWSPTMNVTTPK